VLVGIDVGTGTRLGNYVLSDQIGRGGMGVVYRATHVHLGREVALKILAPELTGSEDFRKRFLRESRLAASLDHPNAVTVYDAGEADGTLYIAMRYVPGSDLAKLLKENAPLESAMALSMLDQVGAALDAAHQLGLIHRDVKPANVLLASGNCYLTDFGITKQVGAPSASALTKTGQFLGTIGYVAPEQIEGREVDGRADIYALTCILYECLTGSRPFPKGSELAVISAHLWDPPPRPTESRPELPEAIDAVVAKGMAKSAADRYPTCSELMAAAREALGARASAGPPGAGSATVSRDRTEPKVAALPSSGTGGTRTVVQSRSPGPRHRRRAVVAGVVVLCAAAIAVAAVLVASGGTAAHKAHTQTEGHTPTAAAAVSSTAAHVVGAPIQVGSQPTGIDGNSSFLWVANFGASTVTRVTPDGKVRTDIRLQPAPFAVLRIGSTFWVSSADAGTVTPISVSTGLPGKPVAVGDKPEWMAGDDDGLWVSNATSDTVSTINPDSGTLIGAPIKVGRVPRGIAYSGSAVWVADSGDDNVDRIANGQVTKTIRVGREPIGVAFGANAVWVANKLDNTVSRIALPQDTTKTIRVGKAPFSIAFGLGAAWVTNSGDDTVTRLDATTGNPVGSPIAVGQDPTGIAVIGQAVWVTNRRSNTVQEIVP
jgi:DNA-binding beta-propeller fold protein YncE